MSDQNLLKSTDTKDNNTSVKSRRKFLVGAAAPAVLSIFSKPVFATGQRACNISGFASVNPSGVARHGQGTCLAGSHRDWGDNCYRNSQHGYIGDWIQSSSNCGISFVPKNPDDCKNHYNIETDDTCRQSYENHFTERHYHKRTNKPETLFRDIFSCNSSKTLHEVCLNDNVDELDFHAAGSLMNACLYNWGKSGANADNIHFVDIIGLYDACAGGSPRSTYTTVKGNVISTPSLNDLRRFFIGLQS